MRGLIEQIEADLGRDSPPTLTLNGHCNECEFRGACRGIAEATDDLSLLRGLSGKEIEKLRGRGIATVAQLSHTYRPGRRGKRRAGGARKHDPALQALALREKKVFVLDRPPMPVPRVALYLDVEGVPDRDFYYLIGLLAVEEGRPTSYSFWADDSTQEKAIWQACARIIEGFRDYTVYHYGRYEQGFLDRMRRSANDGRGGGDRSHPIQVLQRPRGDLLALLFPDPLEQPEGHRQAPGRRVVLRQCFGNPEPGMAAGLGVGPRGGAQAATPGLQPGGLPGARRVTEFVLSACNGGATPPEAGRPSHPPRTSGRRELSGSGRPSSSAPNSTISTSAPTRTTSVRRSTSGPARRSGRACGGSSASARGLSGQRAHRVRQAGALSGVRWHSDPHSPSADGPQDGV